MPACYAQNFTDYAFLKNYAHYGKIMLSKQDYAQVLTVLLELLFPDIYVLRASDCSIRVSQ